MKQRIKWFSLASSGPALSSLAARLRRLQYSEAVGVGFRLEQVGKANVSGSFIERLTYEDQIEDPFGKVLTFKRVEFRVVRFELRDRFPNLEIVDPPRSLKTFFSQLSAAMDHQLEVIDVRPPVLAWLRALEQEVGRVRVRTMKIAALSLSTSVRADLVLRGVDADVRSEAKRLLSGRGAETVLAEVAWRHGDELVECELTRNGAEYSAENEESVGRSLRRALREVVAEEAR